MPVFGGPQIGYSQGNGTLTASGNGEAVPLARRGDWSLSMSGTWVGTVTVERSFNGTVWYPLTFLNGNVIAYTAPMSTILTEPVPNVQVRVVFNRTSGTLDWRIDQ